MAQYLAAIPHLHVFNNVRSIAVPSCPVFDSFLEDAAGRSDEQRMCGETLRSFIHNIPDVRISHDTFYYLEHLIDPVRIRRLEITMDEDISFEFDTPEALAGLQALVNLEELRLLCWKPETPAWRAHSTWIEAFRLPSLRSLVVNTGAAVAPVLGFIEAFAPNIESLELRDVEDIHFGEDDDFTVHLPRLQHLLVEGSPDYVQGIFYAFPYSPLRSIVIVNSVLDVLPCDQYFHPPSTFPSTLRFLTHRFEAVSRPLEVADFTEWCRARGVHFQVGWTPDRELSRRSRREITRGQLTRPASVKQRFEARRRCSSGRSSD